MDFRMGVPAPATHRKMHRRFAENANGRGLRAHGRRDITALLFWNYLAARTHEACGPLSPVVSPKMTLSPSDN
jgi:hypothetical protein